MTDYPYADRFEVHERLPEDGRPPEEILAELREMAGAEDAFWETGKASGTVYCGDHRHYAFMAETYGLFGHANVLQRDMFPSATKFEGEILAMTLDLMHAGAVTGTEPAGIVTTGGTGSILHAMLAYRDAAGLERPNIVKPETAHPAFDKAGHLFGIEVRRAPVDPRTTLVDVDAAADLIDADTVALVGSAGNYGYGTIDPIAELSELALSRGVGLHVDACLGGFILPFGEELGLDVPVFDFRLPGVTSISADTHKYGYGLKGTSTLLFRDGALRNALYFLDTGWSGGKYLSPGIEGSRSGGLLAATWAGMVRLGRSGYRRHAARIFETARRMIGAVRSHPELRVLGEPTFLFSFTSDEFDIYHVYDSMAGRGWRLNGQQYPNAVHMAVTRPQTRPGVAEAFAADLAEAVEYALKQEKAGEAPMSGAVYGGVPGGLTHEADDFIRQVMAGMLDTQQSLPPSAR
ncbi:pyridoxal phosphate-dependent decarboxylase family protein [Actinomadura bangladeshensis]|uniref:Aminotransferase class V-fold PLP-dependent enzyme n=1 Tax=Actinomadura bangladeshensis TaxID=453573 RepID=A0A4R4PD97_9ACTN|nr:aminotransferase class V-fold PLP-dependent enzyme [Actinomadura bangladeshensis]TDC20064.1 aminotransferase class V-fold PLP-dependent enzyme [Actinomadura bangladeshensis]